MADEFDPSQPFEAVDENEFDPNKPFTPIGTDSPSEDGPSALGVIGRGMAQGASFGFADEGMAAVQAPFSDKSYTELRDEKRAQLTRDFEDYPKTHIASQVGGAVAPSIAAEVLSAGTATPVVAGNAARVGMMGKALLNPRTIKGMAGAGAMFGLGGSEADLTEGDATGAALDTTKGAIYGGILGKAMPVAGNLMRKAGGALEGPAELMASKAVGLTKAFKNKFKVSPEQARQTGRVALDEGIVTPFSGADDMLEATQHLNEKIGPEIGKMLKDAERRGIAPDFRGMVERLEAEAAPYGKTKIGRTIYNQYQKVINDLKQYQGTPGGVRPGIPDPITGVPGQSQAVPGTPGGNISDLAEYKKVVGSVAYPKTSGPRLSNEGAIKGYSEVSRGLENVMDEGVPDGPFRELYKSLKQKYGAGSRMEMSLEQARSAADDTPSFLRHPIDATAKKIESYVQPVAAVTMDRVSKLIKSTPDLFGSYGPMLQKMIERGGTSFATNNFILQQRDPEYRKKMEEISNMPEEEGDGSGF